MPVNLIFWILNLSRVWPYQDRIYLNIQLCEVSVITHLIKCLDKHVIKIVLIDF